MLTSLETREPGEAAMTAEMIDILRRKMARDYDAGQTRRDAHPKATGLLRGRFEVEDGLPQHLRVGLFAKAQRYDCWIRTSNSSGKPQSDAIGDARGFAIKLMAPGGKRKDETPLGQDFVLLSTPVMPLGTVALFRDEPSDTWRIEGVREAGAHDERLDDALALAAAVAGIADAAQRLQSLQQVGGGDVQVFGVHGV